MATFEELLQKTLARRNSSKTSPVRDQERENLISELKHSTESLRDIFGTMRGIPPSSMVAAALKECGDFRRVLEAMLLKARKPQNIARKGNNILGASRAGWLP